MNNTNSSDGGDNGNAFVSAADRKLVYIRPILAGDVMSDLADEFGELEINVDADAILYSVHDEDGERLALVGDRELAFAAARQHELTPVSVH